MKADKKKFEITDTNYGNNINNYKHKRGWDDIKFNVNVDANELLETIGKGAGYTIDIINSFIWQNGITDGTPKSGGRFVSLLTDGHIIAAYFHKNKCHYVTASGKTEYTSFALGGEWAKVIVMRSDWGGNKSSPGISCESYCDALRDELRDASISNNMDDTIYPSVCNVVDGETLKEEWFFMDNSTISDNNLNSNNDSENGKPKDENSGTNNFKQFSFISIVMIFASILIWQNHIIF
jgi:hypothetical protein